MRIIIITFLLLVLFGGRCQKSHGAVQLDGVDDYLSTTNGPSGSVGPYGNPNIIWSFGIWVKRFNTNSSWVFLEQHATLANTFLGFRFNNTKTNAAEIVYGSFQENIYSSEPNLGSSTNVWMHFAMRHDGFDTNSTRFFVNGQEVTGAWTTGIGDGIQASSYPWLFGNTRGSFGNFLGQLDEFAYLNGQYLSFCEIANLGRSRVRSMPLQIKANNNAPSANPLSFTCMPFDGFPAFSAPLEDFRDLSKYGRAWNAGNNSSLANFHPNGGLLCVPSGALSYAPNE